MSSLTSTAVGSDASICRVPAASPDGKWVSATGVTAANDAGSMAARLAGSDVRSLRRMTLWTP